MRKTALVIGCSAAVWEEVAAAKELCAFDAVYCVKMAGILYPKKFDVWVTLHPEWMDVYETARSTLGLPSGYEVVVPLKTELGVKEQQYSKGRRVSHRWPGMDASASSGIYGARVALEDGCERVVLAGIPMQQEAGHFTRGEPWLGCDNFLPGFEQALPFMRDTVRSMSGLTQQVLGSVTSEWLRS
jgi:hypothetical protein